MVLSWVSFYFRYSCKDCAGLSPDSLDVKREVCRVGHVR